MELTKVMVGINSWVNKFENGLVDKLVWNDFEINKINLNMMRWEWIDFNQFESEYSWKCMMEMAVDITEVNRIPLINWKRKNWFWINLEWK